MVKGFKMKLYPGQEAEYEKRHNELWPEMQDMIHEYGGANYTIFLDQETLTLFGYIEMVGFYGRYHGNQSGQQSCEHRFEDGVPSGLIFGLIAALKRCTYSTEHIPECRSLTRN